VSELVRIRAEPRCTVVTMDDGKVNALSLAMLRAIHDAVDEAEARRLPLVLAGREGVFSAGFDLEALRHFDRDAVDMVLAGFELAVRLLDCPVPVVVACTGHAIAMGSFVLCSVDHRVGATGEFRIGANEVALGIPLPQVAIEICGRRIAAPWLTRVLVNAEMLGPDDAVAAGFLDELVPPPAVVDAAEAVAERLAALDVGLHAATKRRVREAAIAASRSALARDAAEWGARV
jgi:enoyl-CoA hydratase